MIDLYVLDRLDAPPGPACIVALALIQGVCVFSDPCLYSSETFLSQHLLFTAAPLPHPHPLVPHMAQGSYFLPSHHLHHPHVCLVYPVCLPTCLSFLSVYPSVCVASIICQQLSAPSKKLTRNAMTLPSGKTEYPSGASSTLRLSGHLPS